MSYFRQGAFAPGTTTNITTSGASQSTSTVANTTSIVRVAVTANTYVEVGADPTATANSMVIAANTAELLAVTPGVSKIAVLQVSTSGVASITQLAAL